MTVLRSGSSTDVGRVRSSNQDVALEEPDLFAVADGMGGHVGGEVAARVAVDTLRASFRKQPTVEGLRRAFAEANRDVWRRGQVESGLRGMGTTLTATALVRDPGGRQVIALANVGDSRAYVYSRGQVIQITADHSLAEERVRQGEMTEAEAQVHPQRHILTRALGVSSDVDVDLWELHLTDGDRILLCSDGLTNEVDDQQIQRVLASTSDPQEAARALVRAAVDHGGNDNVTVVVVDVVSAGESAGDPEGGRSRHPVGGSAGGDAPTTAIPALAGTGTGATTPADGGGSDGGGAKGDDAEPAASGSGSPRLSVGGAGGVDEPTGVLRGLAGGRNGRGTQRALAGDRLGRLRRGGNGDPGSASGVVTVTRGAGAAGHDGGREPGVPGSGMPGSGADGPGLGRSGAAGAAGAGGAGPAGRTADASAPGPGGARGPAMSPAGAAGGRRAPTDFGTQAAELRRLRPTRRERRRRRRMAGVPRLVTVRLVLFMILLLAVVAAAYALVRWYAMDDWYVGVNHQHLAVYQGRPGGFLWFKPKLVDETPVATSQILPFHLPAVQADHQEPSLKAARRYVADLHQEYLATQPTATSATSTTGGSTTGGSTTGSTTTTTTGAAG